MIEVIYENPMDLLHWANGDEIPPMDDGLPAVGGPVDGDRFAVSMMFGQLVPQFMRIKNDVYQLHLRLMRWKFAFHIGWNWPGYNPEYALTERPAWRGKA